MKKKELEKINKKLCNILNRCINSDIEKQIKNRSLWDKITGHKPKSPSNPELRYARDYMNIVLGYKNN